MLTRTARTPTPQSAQKLRESWAVVSNVMLIMTVFKLAAKIISAFLTPKAKAVMHKAKEKAKMKAETKVEKPVLELPILMTLTTPSVTPTKTALTTGSELNVWSAMTVLVSVVVKMMALVHLPTFAKAVSAALFSALKTLNAELLFLPAKPTPTTTNTEARPPGATVLNALTEATALPVTPASTETVKLLVTLTKRTTAKKAINAKMSANLVKVSVSTATSGAVQLAGVSNLPTILNLILLTGG